MTIPQKKRLNLITICAHLLTRKLSSVRYPKTRKKETKKWIKEINMKIFGIYIVNIWLTCSQTTGSKCTQSDFYIRLYDETIGNKFDQVLGLVSGDPWLMFRK